MYVSVLSFIILSQVLISLLKMLLAIHLDLLQLCQNARANRLKMLLNFD